MTQPDEIPGQPVPAQGAEPVQPAPPPAAPEPTETAPQPASTPAPDDPSAFAAQAAAVPAPDELAAATAANKAKRRGIFVKSAVLAVPALVLLALLAATGVQANDLSSKTTAASTAAKAATAADALAGQLRAAQSAADASILVDAGCVAVESQTTGKAENKLIADSDSLAKASNGTNFTAFATAANRYINDLQALSTDLQQDAALSKRASVTTAVGAVTSDLKVLISTMQDLLGGNLNNSLMNQSDTAANRMDGDATAVDTLCGGTTLNGTSSPSGGNGNLNA